MSKNFESNYSDNWLLVLDMLTIMLFKHEWMPLPLWVIMEMSSTIIRKLLRSRSTCFSSVPNSCPYLRAGRICQVHRLLSAAKFANLVQSLNSLNVPLSKVGHYRCLPPISISPSLAFLWSWVSCCLLLLSLHLEIWNATKWVNQNHELINVKFVHVCFKQICQNYIFTCPCLLTAFEEGTNSNFEVPSVTLKNSCFPTLPL